MNTSMWLHTSYCGRFNTAWRVPGHGAADEMFVVQMWKLRSRPALTGINKSQIPAVSSSLSSHRASERMNSWDKHWVYQHLLDIAGAVVCGGWRIYWMKILQQSFLHKRLLTCDSLLLLLQPALLCQSRCQCQLINVHFDESIKWGKKSNSNNKFTYTNITLTKLSVLWSRSLDLCQPQPDLFTAWHKWEWNTSCFFY